MTKLLVDHPLGHRLEDLGKMSLEDLLKHDLSEPLGHPWCGLITFRGLLNYFDCQRWFPPNLTPQLQWIDAIIDGTITGTNAMAILRLVGTHGDLINRMLYKQTERMLAK